MIKDNRYGRNRLIIAASESDADLYYATRFLAPDPFVFIQLDAKKYLLINDLELDRARAQAGVHAVLSLSGLAARYRKQSGREPGQTDLVEAFLKKHGARACLVPANFPAAHADSLRKRGIKILVKPGPFFEERGLKTPWEIAAVSHALRATESAVGEAINILRKSSVRGAKLFYRGDCVTSEMLKKIIHIRLLELGCSASHSIVACGADSVDPHNEGSGPVRAGRPVIIDVFPRNSWSRYHGDFTRTVVKGKASGKLKEMYAAVFDAQELVFRSLRPGADGSEIHRSVQKLFEARGFRTGMKDGRMQGFFHGTGHGLGLEVHEPPRISVRKDILKAGHVVTVEPGLYYKDSGGVRLEDVAVITPTGCRNLTRFPKVLEV